MAEPKNSRINELLTDLAELIKKGCRVKELRIKELILQFSIFWWEIQKNQCLGQSLKTQELLSDISKVIKKRTGEKIWELKNCNSLIPNSFEEDAIKNTVSELATIPNSEGFRIHRTPCLWILTSVRLLFLRKISCEWQRSSTETSTIDIRYLQICVIVPFIVCFARYRYGYFVTSKNPSLFVIIIVTFDKFNHYIN